MQVEVRDISGKALKKVDLPDSIFAVEVKDHVLHLAVKAYQANRRQGTHATKTRSFVSGGGKKPFKQKGTGSARQGSTRGPHMPGGAVVHGPQPRDYRQKLNKKAKDLALKMALSDRAKHQKIVIIDDFAISEYSTKHVSNTLKTLKASNALLLDERKDDFLYCSSRNVYQVAALSPQQLNAENVLRHENLIMTENALTGLKQRLEDK